MGLSFLSCVHKCNQQPISNLYDSNLLLHLRTAISRDRSLFPIRFCCIDDTETRDERKDDRFGYICEFWNTFNNRCRELYGIGAHANIDEMLQKFQGHCRFRQCMLSKPGRNSIKDWILADVENNHSYNAIPYFGKEGNGPAMDLGAQVLKKLVEPLKRSNRNITCD